MKYKKIFLLIIFATIFLSIKNVYAYSSDDYKNRSLCGTYEVAGFHSDGTIDKVACYSTYAEAKSYMQSNGADDLAIMTKVSGYTKIIDANVALLDLTVNPNQLTYYYENSELTSRQYTYMNNRKDYGGVDGAHIDSAYSNSKKVWTAKVRIANFTGWISQDSYEIVPITWVNSSSYYKVTNSDISHYYTSKIQENYSGSNRTIGPKPDMLSAGTYYSYDGHYFYKDLKTLIKDYKNNTYSNSVNKSNEYYNYYMYLSNHSKTNYSSINIDEYIRNNLGYSKNVYGNSASSGTSRLYGSGTYFYYAQEKYGVNALLSLSLSRNETANGRSDLAINKNNGFGLNAVDSNPIQAATWYATFSSSILGYASKWITYGYAKATDSRYFGPQFGDKWIGMNVKYAADTYWSEKMAANYYSMDKALGLQDYNYYQLGVITSSTVAYSSPTATKAIYTYPEAEDGVLIVGEITLNNQKWYKVVSDMNVDSNYNVLTSGDYNWNYVYVKSSNVKKINTAKNGYVSPEDVYEYADKDYEYDLYIEDTELKPKVAVTLKNTSYYYDSTLSTKTGSTLLKDRYVMVYSAAYLDNKPVAYLVTSDYKFDQKQWVSADSIKFTNTSYGKVSVTASGNQYTWVNYNTEDAKYSLISGLYTNSYVPVLEQLKVGNDTWYKVPVSLTSNDNVYGYTLSSADNVSITLNTPTVENNLPVITASDVTIIEGSTFNALNNVKATDEEDGDLTSSIQVVTNTVNTKTPGTYEVTYKVTDKANATTTKTIKVTVKENTAPVITASDKTINQGTSFNELDDVEATDTEDGNITKNIEVVENTVNIDEAGEYKVIYKVTDSNGKSSTKQITVTVINKKLPTINAEDVILYVGEEFDELKDVEATDYKGNDITAKIKVISNNVNNKSAGTYKVTYQVTDNENNTQELTIDVVVIDLQSMQKEASFYFDYLKEVNNDLEIKGYNTIKGMNNTLDEDIEYYLLFESLNSDDYYELQLDRITNKSEMTRPVYSEDNYDYTYSWFKGTIDTSNIPDGDYKLYILSICDDAYSTSVVSNKVLKTQVSSYKNDKYITTRNNYYDSDTSLELIIRSEKIAEKTATSTYNQYNQYRTLEFTNNKLHIKGTSYSYGMNLSSLTTVDRKIIFEDTSTYKKYVYNLGSITEGLYAVGSTLNDKLDKTRAWFDTTIDISDLPKGNYAIYISNSSNIKDYGELNEILLRDISKISTTINNKTYSFSLNKDLRYRIELNVK